MKIIKNTQGVSLLFVLASMLFLLALGVSALTAAGLSHRAERVQSRRNQMAMYTSSMERVIRAALEEEGGDTLTGHIFEAVFNEAVFDYEFVPTVMTGSALAGWEMVMTADSPDGGAEYAIVISIERLTAVSEFQQHINAAASPPAIALQRWTLDIDDVRIAVEMTVTHGGETVSTERIYGMWGGRIERTLTAGFVSPPSPPTFPQMIQPLYGGSAIWGSWELRQG
jgi:hypothetical protein